MKPRILLVEDDDKLGTQIVDYLADAGLDPAWVKSGDDAMRVEPDPFSLVILDLMLPGAYGLDVLKHLRESSDVPVLVLSARNETVDKVRALELGADDFVTKPFWPEELLARVQARLRRPAMQRGSTIRIGELSIDVPGRQVRVGEKSIDLTRVEFELLAALAKRPGAAVSRASLADRVLDPDRDGGVRTLDVHVSRLRKKLGDSGKCVATVWGVGYRLETEDPS